MIKKYFKKLGIIGIVAVIFPLYGFSQKLLSLQTAVADTIESKALKNTQQILIHLPNGYSKSESETYPVVYYFDAQDETFGNLVTVNTDRLMWTKDIPNVITVGIVQWDRSYLSIERQTEKGKSFLEYITTELIPYIEQKYRTSDYRVFVGHSLGGQFVTYGMTQHPETFNGVVAISPALFYPDSEKWFQQKTISALKNFRRTTLKKPIHYYYTVGATGYQDFQFKEGVFSLDSVFRETSQANFFSHFDYLPYLNHSNSPTVGIPMGLVNIFYDWKFPERATVNILLNNIGNPLKLLQNHENQIRNKYGVSLPIPKQFYWQFAKYCIEKESYKDGRVIIEKFIERAPEDFMPFSLMGDLLEKEKDYLRAIEYYQQAQAKLDKSELQKQKEYIDKIETLKELLK